MVATWVALVFAGFICLIIKDTSWFADNMPLVSWYVIFCVSCVFVVSMFKKYGSKFYDFKGLMIIFTGYFIRIFFLLWDRHLTGVLGNVPGTGPDPERFYAAALGLRPHTWVYADFLEIIFQIFGPQRIIGQYINILLGISAVFVGMEILRKYTLNKNITMIALAIGMLLPYYMIMNVFLAREGIIAFFIITSLYFFIYWLRSDKFSPIIFTFLCILMATLFHAGSFAVLIGYMTYVVFYDRKNKKFNFKPKSIVLILIFLSLVYMADYYFGTELFRQFQRFDTIEDVLIFADVDDPVGGAGYTTFINTGNTTMDFIVNTPVRMVYFLLSPMPWYWRGPQDIIAFALSSSFYGYTYFIAFRAVKAKEIENREIIIFLFIASVIATFIFGWGVRNAGTAMRHRDKFFMQHVLMLVLSIQAISNRYEIPFFRKLHGKLQLN